MKFASIAAIVWLLVLPMPCMSQDETDGHANALADNIMRNLAVEAAQCPAQFKSLNEVCVLFCGKVGEVFRKHEDHLFRVVDGVLALAISEPPRPDAWQDDEDLNWRDQRIGEYNLTVLYNSRSGKIVISYPRQFETCPDSEVEDPPSDAEVKHAVPLHESMLPPVYPTAAGVARIRAVVVVKSIIQKDGTPRKVCAQKANPEGLGFEKAAVDCLQGWRYEPCTADGEPIECNNVTILHFDPTMRHFLKKGLD